MPARFACRATEPPIAPRPRIPSVWGRTEWKLAPRVGEVNAKGGPRKEPPFFGRSVRYSLDCGMNVTLRLSNSAKPSPEPANCTEVMFPAVEHSVWPYASGRDTTCPSDVPCSSNASKKPVAPSWLPGWKPVTHTSTQTCVADPESWATIRPPEFSLKSDAVPSGQIVTTLFPDSNPNPSPVGPLSFANT